ncbi:MAG: OmpA family protein [Alphaproteobacteria bacterium]
MRRTWRRAIFWAIPLGLFLANAAAAQGIKSFMDKNPTSDELIDALTPHAADTADNPAVQYRGLTVTKKAGQTTALQPAAMPVVALNVNFAFNSAELTRQSRELLNQLALAMQSPALQHYRFQLEGHTDSKGSAVYNQKLSQRRAQSVRDYLSREEKIPATRLMAVGKGATEPLDPAHPEDAINRRVQIANLGN